MVDIHCHLPSPTGSRPKPSPKQQIKKNEAHLQKHGSMLLPASQQRPELNTDQDSLVMIFLKCRTGPPSPHANETTPPTAQVWKLTEGLPGNPRTNSCPGKRGWGGASDHTYECACLTARRSCSRREPPASPSREISLPRILLGPVGGTPIDLVDPP